MSTHEPWFKSEVTKHLDKLLQPDWVVLETGCGGSTIWYAERVAEVHSFEHDKAWYFKTLNLLREEKIENVWLYYSRLYPEKGIPMKDFPCSSDGNKMFDFISIDGRGRMKSIETTIGNLKSGGYLLLDDCQRERYEILYPVYQWSNVHFTKHEKQTIIWKKP